MKKVGKSIRSFKYDLNKISYDYTMEVRNRFQGLDLIGRVSDELWMEIHDTVQETGIKTIPKKKKCKKAKLLSEEALQIAVKGREAKSKGEKERYTHLNVESHSKMLSSSLPPAPSSLRENKIGIGTLFGIIVGADPSGSQIFGMIFLLEWYL